MLLLLATLLSALIIPIQANTRNAPEASILSIDIQPKQTEEKPYAGHIRIANEFCPTDMNPLIDWRAFSAFGEHPIYSPLFRSDENGTLRSCLAVNYTTDDGIRFVINLVQNATFHSGALFTVDDAITTLELIVNNTDPNLDPLWSLVYGLHGLVESIERLGDYQFAINLNKTYLSDPDILGWDSWPNFPIALDRLPMLRKDIVENLKPNGEIDGTGPYKLSSLNLGHSMTLFSNINYFLGRPYISNITYQWGYSIDQFAQAIIDNEIDVANFAYDFSDPVEVSKTTLVAGVSTRSVIDSTLWYVGMNLRNPYLANKTIRQAIYIAINRKGICNGPFQGYAVPAIGYVCPGYTDWYNPSVLQYPYSPIAAQQILGSLNLNLTLIVGDWDEYRLGISSVIAQNLMDVGVNVTVRELNKTAFDSIYDYYTGDYDYDLAIEDIVWLGYDPDNAAYLFWYTDWGLARIHGFSNSTIDQMINQTRTTLDKIEKQQWFNWVQGNISYICPMAFLCWNKLTVIQNDDFYEITESSCINLCDSIVLEEAYYQPTLSSEGKSPMHFVVIDSEGRRTGEWNGSYYEEIPGSVYKPEENLTLIPYPAGEYRILLNGTGNGSYSFDFVNLGLGYRSAPKMSTGVIRTNQTREYKIRVYEDGRIFVFDCALDLEPEGGDGDIDIFDIVVMAGHYGSKLGDPDWYEAVDIAPPIDKIDIFDIVVIAGQYGKEWS